MSQIAKNSFVAFTYKITDEKGETLELIDMPINYVQGSRHSQVIEKIERALEGHQENDEIEISISPQDGFGNHDPSLSYTDEIGNVPEQFRHIGAEVEFQNDQGESRVFRVTQIDGNNLTVDGNHPFAGMTVTYTIKVITVRAATVDEIKKGVEQTIPYLH